MSFRDPPTENHTCSTAQAESREARVSGQHPITGVVNRVKVPNATEEEAILTDPSVTTVMLSIDCARKLVELHSETAMTYFRDDQTVITTTTLHDETLKGLDWLYELDVIRQFIRL